jgi:Transcriptional regulators
MGRRPPMSVISLAEAVGMDKGQISRALAELVSRKLVAKAVNPRDNREVLVCLTRTAWPPMTRLWRVRRNATGACWNSSVPVILRLLARSIA